MRDQRYLKLLHGNFIRLSTLRRSKFTRGLRRDADAISDSDIQVLLSSEWRSQLTASWLIAASARGDFVGQMGDHLAASQLVYAGQGFCVALGGIGGPEAAARLTEYLELRLPQVKCRYDQPWAMAALLCLDGRAGSDHGARFLTPGGLWETWSVGEVDLTDQVAGTEALLEAIRP